MPSLVRLISGAARPALCRHRPAVCPLFTTARAIASNSGSPPDNDAADIAKLLQQPSWSVASLLSEDKTTSQEASQEASKVTVDQLRHLLRLSALPFPADPKEQAAKIETLRTQLRFVRHVQRVDTTGLKPLQAIRDETPEGMKQYTIGIKDVEQTLLQEEFYGHNRRPRRRKGKVDVGDVEDWDALATASRKAGRYIVVNKAE